MISILTLIMIFIFYYYENRAWLKFEETKVKALVLFKDLYHTLILSLYGKLRFKENKSDTHFLDCLGGTGGYIYRIVKDVDSLTILMYAILYYITWLGWAGLDNSPML